MKGGREAPLREGGGSGRALPARFSRWTNIGTQSGRGHRFLRDLSTSLEKHLRCTVYKFSGPECYGVIAVKRHLPIEHDQKQTKKTITKPSLFFLRQKLDDCNCTSSSNVSGLQ